MDCYNMNTESLKQYRRNIYEKMMDSSENNDSLTDLRISSVPSRDGKMTLVISKENRDYRMNSLYQPLKEAELWSAQFSFDNLGIVVSMYGLGNGIFARQLAERMDDTMTMLIYEPNAEVFVHVIENYDLTDLLENPKILIAVEGLNGDDFKKRLEQIITHTNMNSQIVCVHPQYDKVFLEDSIKFLKVISENNSQTEINRNTNAFFGRDIIENTINNMKFVRNASTVLELASEEFGDIPAIIVSAGPSLDKNIDLLREAKGRSVIVATDTAMQFLYAHGIVPDCFVTLDPLKAESYLNDPRYLEVPLFTKIESNWRILHKHKAKKIFYDCQAYMELLFQKLGKRISDYSSGGSVATGAFSVCAALGFKKVILIGQDLAYSGERTHAGTLVHKAPDEESGARYVEGVDGEEVKTRYDWYIYLKWFEASIEELKGKIEVIDATEGGAKIHGSRIMSLREAIENFCGNNFDFAEMLRSRPNILNEQEIHKFFELMQETGEELGEVRRKAEEASEICEEIIKALKRNNQIDTSLTKKSKKLGKINSEIESYMAYRLLDEYIAEISANLLSGIYQFTSDEEMDRMNTYRKAYIFYQFMSTGASAIKSMMEEALEGFWDDEARPMKKSVVAVLQVGIGASKSGSKMMRKLQGKTVLEHVVERLHQSQKIDKIVLATSIKEEDDVIEREGRRLGVKVSRGKEEDVLSILHYSAKDYRANTIVRLAAGCPLMDPFIIDHMIEYYQTNKYDIVTNYIIEPEQRTFPEGLEIEVFSNEKLSLTYINAREARQRENATAYFYDNFNVGYYFNDINYSNHRWVLDTEEDWKWMEEIYRHLYHGKHDFYFKDVLGLMKNCPELQRV